MDMIWITAGLLLLPLGWVLFQQGRLRELLLRQEARFDEQARRLEALDGQLDQRVRAMETALRELDQHLREGQAGAREQQQAATFTLQQVLEQRLSEQISAFGQIREQFAERQTEALKLLQDSLQGGMERTQRLLADHLSRSAEELGKRVDALTQSTDQRLQEISGQVEKRLSEGFEKTTATFADVVKRLALIDEAQKRITELSSNVVSLQEVLADKRSRGAFGEVQLASLVRNVLPESGFALQYGLKNGTRVDCILFLPPPSGHIAIDAKFPLESYQRMTDRDLADAERKQAERQFKLDIRKHVQDIADKYIVSGETADGAVMFIPAEAIFAEIHAHHPDLVELAQRARVWMCSPTTLMAVLTTARAVLKDAATREQVHIIQEHLGMLSKDFGLFQKRMEALATHIRQANKDVDEVGISARKISDRFHKIEKVELATPGQPPVVALEEILEEILEE